MKTRGFCFLNPGFRNLRELVRSPISSSTKQDTNKPSINKDGSHSNNCDADGVRRMGEVQASDLT